MRLVTRIVVLTIFSGIIIASWIFFFYHGWHEFTTEGSQLTEREWSLLRWGFIFIVGQVLLFFIALGKNYFGLVKDKDLIEIARHQAHRIVLDSKGNPNSLKISYLEARKQLVTEQQEALGKGKVFINELLKEFGRETKRQAKEAVDWDRSFQEIAGFTLPSDKEADSFEFVLPIKGN
ncbi:MAG: hypothetical protein V3V99_11865 [candidate division Zixibacteria bacterium]